MRQALRRDILEILNVRFQETSTQLDESVERIDAVDRLRLLLRSAATVGSIQEFMALVKEEGE